MNNNCPSERDSFVDCREFEFESFAAFLAPVLPTLSVRTLPSLAILKVLVLIDCVVPQTVQLSIAHHIVISRDI